MARDLKDRRLELDAKLRSFLGSDEVYFQPPETIKMKYPSIVYNLYRVNQRFASDSLYRKLGCYSVTIIDRSPNPKWIDRMLDSFSYCSLERVYVGDNLNHYSFVLYY